MNELPQSIFSGLFLAALCLGAVDGSYVAVQASADLDLFGRMLAALYALSPVALLGFSLASVGFVFAQLWVHTRQTGLPRAQKQSRWSDTAATLLATLLFVASMYLLGRFSQSLAGLENHRGHLLALGLPIILAFSIYVWLTVRYQLGRLERTVGRWPSLLLTLIFIALGALLPARAIGQNDALAELLKGWPTIFVCSYPVLGFLLTLWFLAHRASGASKGGINRVFLAFGLLCSSATVDLVYRLEELPNVRAALLADTLFFQRVVVVAQPLFDRDKDGYASLLGGGDCDDTNPAVHPGAKEVPRNGIDDDCYNGDDPGRRIPKVVLPKAPRSAKARGLIERPNLILITVDTLRADHLGFMGYERPTSPHLDTLAEASLRFRWAFAQGPQTRSSMPSMFTGRYFSEVDRTGHTWATIHESNVMLAERLKAKGYATAGIPCHEFFFPGYGLNQGFDDWDTSILRKFKTKIPYVITGNLTSDRAIDWLERRAKNTEKDGAPFFLWLHYFDPHFKYIKHPAFNFGDSDIDRYDSEIAFTDQQIGRFLTALKNSPFADNAYLIIHSDHSEGFGLHGYRYHSQHLYNDQVHVPLIIHGPGIKPRQWDVPVSLLDIVPTVLDLAGIPKPADLSGVSLIPYGSDITPPPHPPVYVEMLKDATHSDRRVIIDWPWKYQYGITFGEYSLYNLANDPNEQNNLHQTYPGIARALEQKLRRWMSSEINPRSPRP
ncbi:MAG: sulfatase-like hydrolase/transferase [Myxococcota bacterium]|nr:sulfatase-like hydrolase/transferase [Myxococcota bacterium]